MRITETVRARQHFTPETRSLFRSSTLDSRLGRSTVAGALNDQVRFRFDKTGTPTQWGLVPDNELTADLAASPAGPKLEAKLRDVLRTVERGHAQGALQLQGIMLSDDEEAWAAGLQLMMRDAARTSDAPMLRPPTNKDALAGAEVTANLAGAQSIYGWVHVAPDHARSMLTSVGAYSPAASEKFARSGVLAEHVGQLLGHELEHRVSEADFRTVKAVGEYMPIAWIEEGTATLLEMDDPRTSASNAAAWGVSRQQHAGHVGAPDSFDPGWKPWERDESYWKSFEETAKVNYGDSVVTLKGLLRLAGVDRRTIAGRERTEQLLQDAVVTEVPTVLAKAILAERGLRASRARVEDLSEHIVNANVAGGVDRVEAYLERIVARNRP
jgi:hypothetical protein